LAKSSEVTIEVKFRVPSFNEGAVFIVRDSIFEPVEREVYVTICKDHSGGPASPHNEDCFVLLGVVDLSEGNS